MNFFNRQSSNVSGSGNNGGIASNLNAPSTNSLFGGDSTSAPVGQQKRGAGGAPNVVADDADDDWDNDDAAQPVNAGNKVNQRE